jgi:NADPH:quinone reductase-like Zn-dependent oxidoreductase
MRVYRFHAFGDDLASLAMEDADVPAPGRGQVLVRIRANALNYRDLVVARGEHPNLRPGLVPLSDGAGEVVGIGTEVDRVRVGDRVVASYNQAWISGPPEAEFLGGMLGGWIDGVLAEYVLLDQQGVVRLPDHLSFEEGATLPCAGVTAWSSLTCGAPLRAGQTVLVQGTGGVSIFALQIALLSGCRVIATTSSEAKAERLRALGADHVVNYVETPDWGRAVREATGGRGVDRIVEVGGPGTLEQALGCAAVGAQIALVGYVAGLGAQINPRLLMRPGLGVHGLAVGSRSDLAALAAALEARRVRPVIDRVFPFEDAKPAYRHLESRGHFGKVVIAGA